MSLYLIIVEFNLNLIYFLLSYCLIYFNLLRNLKSKRGQHGAPLWGRLRAATAAGGAPAPGRCRRRFGARRCGAPRGLSGPRRADFAVGGRGGKKLQKEKEKVKNSKVSKSNYLISNLLVF